MTIALSAWGWSAQAEAGPNDNSSSRPVSVQAGLGPIVNLEGGGASGRLALDFEYHFFGGDVGPALGLQAPLHFDSNMVGMNIGPIFLWDFRIAEVGGSKMYLAPLATTGYGFTNVHGGGRSATGHYWYLTVGGQFKVLWNDTVGVFVRPLSFDVWAGEGGATGNWSLTAGVAAAF